jgi:hypothetical protein
MFYNRLKQMKPSNVYIALDPEGNRVVLNEIDID